MFTLLSAHGVDAVQGVALDLGVSSMQLDQAERGFSFRFEGPLDMRMERAGKSAADLVNELAERPLADLIFTFGEEKKARRVAKAIVRDRWVDPGTGKTYSKVRFVEIGRDGEELPPKDVIVEGETVYFDALVCKFDRDLVVRGTMPEAIAVLDHETRAQVKEVVGDLSVEVRGRQVLKYGRHLDLDPVDRELGHDLLRRRGERARARPEARQWLLVFDGQGCEGQRQSKHPGIARHLTQGFTKYNDGSHSRNLLPVREMNTSSSVFARRRTSPGRARTVCKASRIAGSCSTTPRARMTSVWFVAVTCGRTGLSAQSASSTRPPFRSTSRTSSRCAR